MLVILCHFECTGNLKSMNELHSIVQMESWGWKHMLIKNK